MSIISTTLSDQMRVILQSFIGDPPDNAFQRGYLAASLVIANEVVGISKADPVWLRANALLDDDEPKRSRPTLVRATEETQS